MAPHTYTYTQRHHNDCIILSICFSALPILLAIAIDTRSIFIKFMYGMFVFVCESVEWCVLCHHRKLYTRQERQCYGKNAVITTTSVLGCVIYVRHTYCYLQQLFSMHTSSSQWLVCGSGDWEFVIGMKNDLKDFPRIVETRGEEGILHTI